MKYLIPWFSDMLMPFLFFLFSIDTLPPLPDPSKAVFPEPSLWLESISNFFNLSGYAGDFYGTNCKLKIQRLRVSAVYEQKNEWAPTNIAEISSSYSLPLPHFWFKPSMHGYTLERNDKYKLLDPGLNFASTLPRVIIFGKFNYNLWKINQNNYNEQTGKLEIIFDKTKYLPHFELSGIHGENFLKPKIIGKLHISNIHLGVGSLIYYGFPSPYFQIQYLDPRIKLETEIKSGLDSKSLKEHFDSEIPIKFSPPIPDESLTINIGIKINLDFHNHLLGFTFFYKNWNTKLSIDDSLKMVLINDVEEINTEFFLKNSFIYKSLELTNSLYCQSNRSNLNLPFTPIYSLIDTFDFDYSFLQVSIATKYLSKRDGINKTLPEIVIINPLVGLKYKFLKIFVSVFNITNKRNEIFDNYFINERQYAGGIVMNF